MMPSAEALRGTVRLDLAEFTDPPAAPHALIRTWLESAVERQVREPFAVVLATMDDRGRPSTRVVLLKDADERGLVFTSVRDSRKGQHLAVRPWASATFYWRETLQQLTVDGWVEELDPAESDKLFALRPLAAQAATTVSRQSRPLADEADLHDRARALTHAGEPLTRPQHWTGYRLVPDSVEFWHGNPARLHRRLRYDRAENTPDGWTHHRLQP